ncbi:MAG TPA: XisI protein, partial [Bacteroidetes bacterium]|nr:XisI protein [Bacteroidota bacterium]
MDNLKKYESIIKNVIRKYAVYYKESNLEEYEKQLVFDSENHHYFLMDVGWNDMKRIHFCLLHIDIKNDKIWIQKDFTENGVATDL